MADRAIWTLRDEIDAAERRLTTMCHKVQAGLMQGGGREFERAIDAQFRSIKQHPEFAALPGGLDNEEADRS